MWQKETENGSKGPWGSKEAGLGQTPGPALKMKKQPQAMEHGCL